MKGGLVKMAKKLLGKNIGKFAFRILFNIVVAAVILSVLGSFLVEQNVVVSSIITLVILIVIVPMIFKKRQGQESMMALALAIPAGVVMLNLLTEFFPTVAFPILDTSVGVLSPEFGLLIGAYFLADFAFISFFRK